MDFNHNQIEAINHMNGAMIVLAGPGSGKTTVITHRIKNMILNEIPQDKILVITFTKATALEMEERFNKLTSFSYKVSFGTLHSLFFRVLVSHFNYKVQDILSKLEIDSILKNIIKTLDISDNDEEEFIQNIKNEISLIKNELIELDYYNSNTTSNSNFKSIYKMYEEIKRENNKLDFDDMLFLSYNILNENFYLREKWQKKYNYVLIDEFQDINKVQYECIKIISEKHKNIFAVGDDDQSIYKFRGSSPEILLNFTKDYNNAKKVILDINYRSTNEIISFCNKVISQNEKRYKKTIVGTGKVAKKPKIIYFEDPNHEAMSIANKIKNFSNKINYEEMAIIYRTNSQATYFVDSFMNLNVPFQLKDELPNIYEYPITKDILSYLKLSLNRQLDIDVERIINKPKRYISNSIVSLAKKSDVSALEYLNSSKNMKNWQISKIEELEFYLNAIKKRKPYEAIKYIRKGIGYDTYVREYAQYKNISSKGMFEVLDEIQEISKNHEHIEQYLNYIENFKNEIFLKKNDKIKKGVTLTTMHSSKGLEYNTVFVVGANESIIPHEKTKTIEEYEEELRLIYVAMTRAKRSLYVSVLKSRHEKDLEITRFLSGIVRKPIL